VNTLITIDGSQGEGGGQILRSALSLSLLTQTPIRIRNIRAKRSNPGLQRQHLAAVRAAGELGSAALVGASLGSSELSFEPGPVRAGDFHFSVGSAGSTTLVLQTVLPPLLVAGGRSTVVVEGGTHNIHAPPFDFLERAFLPLIARMGPRVTARLERAGFFPAGGGRIVVTIEPAPLRAITLLERGEIRACRADALVARLPRHIGERELKVVAAELHRLKPTLQVREIADSAGPGNLITVAIESEHVVDVFTGFGERGKPAEKVAHDAVGQARDYVKSGVPVGPHLADQLLLPMALAGGGAFRTTKPTSHLLTNIEVIGLFLPVAFTVDELGEDDYRIAVAGASLEPR